MFWNEIKDTGLQRKFDHIEIIIKICVLKIKCAKEYINKGTLGGAEVHSVWPEIGRTHLPEFKWGLRHSVTLGQSRNTVCLSLLICKMSWIRKWQIIPYLCQENPKWGHKELETTEQQVIYQCIQYIWIHRKYVSKKFIDPSLRITRLQLLPEVSSTSLILTCLSWHLQ